jgi:hypothetical protein
MIRQPCPDNARSTSRRFISFATSVTLAPLGKHPLLELENEDSRHPCPPLVERALTIDEAATAGTTPTSPSIAAPRLGSNHP